MSYCGMASFVLPQVTPVPPQLISPSRSSCFLPSSRRKVVGSCSLISFCGRGHTILKAKAKAASSSSPWLMLPPSELAYNFYSLAEDKVLSLNKLVEPSSSELPDDEAAVKGMSHGWVISYNCNLERSEYEGDGNLFLTNPLCHRHIKLPSGVSLPYNISRERYHPVPPRYPDLGPLPMYVKEVVISNPDPDSEDCRAVMIYGPERRLAFCCCPGGGKSNWKPFGDDKACRQDYCSLVYSAHQKLLFCLKSLFNELEAWDLSQPDSSVKIPMRVPVHAFSGLPVPAHPLFSCNFHASSPDDIRCTFFPSSSLALDHKSDDLYLVRRFIVPSMGPDGSVQQHPWEMGPDGSFRKKYPYRTTDFDVFKLKKVDDDDDDEFEWEYMDDCSLDGMAIFIGKNQGFALSPADHPHLKPDSIYFTDIDDDFDLYVEGHDIGIFNYRNRTISPCYYPCDYHSITNIVPAPFWFTPSPTPTPTPTNFN